MERAIQHGLNQHNKMGIGWLSVHIDTSTGTAAGIDVDSLVSEITKRVIASLIQVLSESVENLGNQA